MCSKESNNKPWGRAKKEVLGKDHDELSWVRTMTFRVGSHETETCSKVPNEKPWGRAKKEVLGKDHDLPGRKS